MPYFKRDASCGGAPSCCFMPPWRAPGAIFAGCCSCANYWEFLGMWCFLSWLATTAHSRNAAALLRAADAVPKSRRSVPCFLWIQIGGCGFRCGNASERNASEQEMRKEANYYEDIMILEGHEVSCCTPGTCLLHVDPAVKASKLEVAPSGCLQLLALLPFGFFGSQFAA